MKEALYHLLLAARRSVTPKLAGPLIGCKAAMYDCARLHCVGVNSCPSSPWSCSAVFLFSLWRSCKQLWCQQNFIQRLLWIMPFASRILFADDIMTESSGGGGGCVKQWSSERVAASAPMKEGKRPRPCKCMRWCHTAARAVQPHDFHQLLRTRCTPVNMEQAHGYWFAKL